MKMAFVCLLSVVSVNAFAQSEISASAKDMALVSSKNKTLEMGLDISSINNGTPFATVAYVHEFQSGFAVGGRGYMPLEFSNQKTAYLMQVLGRFMLINDINRAFVEAKLTQGFFNEEPSLFAMIGGDFGYTRMITRDISVGLRLGADLSTSRISNNRIELSRTIFNHIGIDASYYF